MQTYTYALIGNYNLNLLYVCNGQSVYIQAKHQDTNLIFHHNLVILGMISCANLYLCTHWNYNLNLLYVCNGEHSDETSGHEPDFPSQFSYLTNDNLCKHILMHSLETI